MTILENKPMEPSILERDELRVLLERRASMSNAVRAHLAAGDLDNNDPYHRAKEALQSIDRQLSQLRADLFDGSDSVHDGVVRVGSVVTVRFDGDQGDAETFVLVHGGSGFEHADHQSCSAASPLGEALLGSRVDDSRTYSLPSGSACTVTVLAVR